MTTNYFSHDSNARNDEKLLRLRMRHKAAGYGVYFMILERMREEKNYMCAKDYNMIAFDLREDAALIKSVVEDFGLFVFTDDGKYFYSESFLRRMDTKDKVSMSRSKAARARWKPQEPTNTEQEQSDASKGKENKEIGSPPARAQTNDDNAFFKRFFQKSNQANIEALLMSLGLQPNEQPLLRSLAKEVINEWMMIDKHHANYTDWSQHLISTIRIKLKNNDTASKPTNDRAEDVARLVHGAAATIARRESEGAPDTEPVW